MLFRERGTTFGSCLGLILQFLVVERKERQLLVQAAAQEGSAQPKDWEGSRQGMPGQENRGGGDHRAPAAPHHHRSAHPGTNLSTGADLGTASVLWVYLLGWLR